MKWSSAVSDQDVLEEAPNYLGHVCYSNKKYCQSQKKSHDRPSRTGAQAVEAEHSPQVPKNRFASRHNPVISTALISSSVLILIGVCAYFAYAACANSQLDNLTFSAEAYVASSFNVAVHQSTQSNLTSEEQRYSNLGLSNATVKPNIQKTTVGLLRYIAAYPGLQLHPKYWHEPLWAGSDRIRAQFLPDGFRKMDGVGWLRHKGKNALAHRIQIPMIRMDSSISDLAILDLGNSHAYETPKNTVGHIPGTSNPGEQGSGWFFGHLESPIKGEGNVFHRLPEIPALLRNYIETGDDPIYVTLSSTDGEYLYVVTATQIVHQDDLSIYDSEHASIMLVTCFPRLVYDHRLLITAMLVGIK